MKEWCATVRLSQIVEISWIEAASKREARRLVSDSEHLKRHVPAWYEYGSGELEESGDWDSVEVLSIKESEE